MYFMQRWGRDKMSKLLERRYGADMAENDRELLHNFQMESKLIDHQRHFSGREK
jgi:hypothetical protein